MFISKLELASFLHPAEETIHIVCTTDLYHRVELIRYVLLYVNVCMYVFYLFLSE